MRRWGKHGIHLKTPFGQQVITYMPTNSSLISCLTIESSTVEQKKFFCALLRNCNTTVPNDKSVAGKTSFGTNIHNFGKFKIDLLRCENRLEMWENGKTWELLWRPSDEMAGHISGSQNSNPKLFSSRQYILGGKKWCKKIIGAGFEIIAMAGQWSYDHVSGKKKKNNSNTFWKEKKNNT